MTCDGLFLIEQGRITRAFRYERFNESPLYVLNDLAMLGAAERIAGAESGEAVMTLAIEVRDFNVTSLSEAV